MNVIRAAEYDEKIRDKISSIFVDGFYQWLKFFSKDKQKLTNAFLHMFNLNVFYTAAVDNETVGIAACTYGKTPSVKLDRSEFKAHLGLFMGTIAYRILRNEFERKQYPFAVEKGMGMVEFVATSSKYRGQGVASAIIKHIFDHTPYSVYVLEVADTNSNAVKLYEKLGFTEFMRVKQKHSKRSGVNYLVYMKYTKKE